MNQKKYYAQFGEDRILDQIFNKKNGVCIEVGGFDGVTGSNSYFFESLGWRCLIIEPMPEYCEKIKKIRGCEVVEVAASDKAGLVEFYIAAGVETLSTMENNLDHFARIQSLSDQEIKKITVRAARLDDILAEQGIREIDFMTIDVEGHELSALSGMSFNTIAPRFLIIEDNSNGESRDVKNFMETFLYVRFKRTGCNDWYAKRGDPMATNQAVIGVELYIFLSSKWRHLKNCIKRIFHISRV
jgi:FkbM family methyltransferase